MTPVTTAALCATSMVAAFTQAGLRLLDLTIIKLIRNSQSNKEKEEEKLGYDFPAFMTLGGKFHANSLLPHHHLHGRRGKDFS